MPPLALYKAEVGPEAPRELPLAVSESPQPPITLRNDSNRMASGFCAHRRFGFRGRVEGTGIMTVAYPMTALDVITACGHVILSVRDVLVTLAPQMDRITYSMFKRI